MSAPDPRKLETLSVRQLADLQGRITTQIARKAEEAKTELQVVRDKKLDDLRRQLKVMAETLGAKTEDVFGSSDPVPMASNGHSKKAKGKRKQAVPVKFRDKEDPAHTWTGRGRQPRWLAAAIQGGRKLDEFRIA